MIEIFKWSIIIFSKVNFVFKHWNRRILYFSTCKYLSFNHCRNISFSVSETNFDGFVFSNILKFIKLRNGLFLSCAHWKMSIFYNNFIVKFINLFLSLLLQLFYHILSWYEHCFEILFRWKSWLFNTNFSLKIWFSIISRIIIEPLHFFFAKSFFFVVRIIYYILNCRIIRSFWMLIPVWFFHDIIKSILCFPSILVFLLFFNQNIIFVY